MLAGTVEKDISSHGLLVPQLLLFVVGGLYFLPLPLLGQLNPQVAYNTLRDQLKHCESASPCFPCLNQHRRAAHLRRGNQLLQWLSLTCDNCRRRRQTRKCQQGPAGDVQGQRSGAINSQKDGAGFHTARERPGRQFHRILELPGESRYVLQLACNLAAAHQARAEMHVSI